MTGFHHTKVVHMYGNKRFTLVRAAMSTSDRGDVLVSLQSKKQRGKAPVILNLAPEDAVRLGAELMESGRAGAQESA